MIRKEVPDVIVLQEVNTAWLEALDVILIGDLNMTPWSHYFGRLERESGLRDAGKGLGLAVSWPTFCPALGVPIDHCLVSPGVGVCDRRTGSSIGSDHYPVIFELAPSVNDEDT